VSSDTKEKYVDPCKNPGNVVKVRKVQNGARMPEKAFMCP